MEDATESICVVAAQVSNFGQLKAGRRLRRGNRGRRSCNLNTSPVWCSSR